MDLLTYYAQQSPIADPAEYVGLFADLPRDIAGLRRVSKMLACLVELDDRPLTEARPPEKHLIGCCRDFASLFCPMERHQGIPTPTRVGFATYFIPGYNVDHEVVEYWDAQEERWWLDDPQIAGDLHRQAYHLQFDPLDVPRSHFILGGQAWQMYRAREADPEAFGLSPDSDLKG